MKQIQLTQGFVALIDDADEPLVSGRSWSVTPPHAGGNRYAQANVDGRCTLMHTVLMGKRAGYIIDHKDGDGLNCTRDNMRWATYSQNGANNRRPRPPSGYRGVYIRGERFFAAICVMKRTIYLGSFDSAKEAAAAYDKAAREHYGEFAHLNLEVG